MEFGQLKDRRVLDDPQFGRTLELPPDPPVTQKTLETLGRASDYSGDSQRPPRVWLGAPVYSDPRWCGPAGVYPPGTPAKRFLDEYVLQFNSLEVNSTFYGSPTSATVARWAELSLDRAFRFCPKFPQEISRATGASDVGERASAFANQLRPAARSLGPTLLQLPPSFSPEQLQNLRGILRVWPIDLAPVAVEFRHEGFFGPGGLRNDALGLLQEHRALAAITDSPGRRDALHMSVLGSIAYIRFAGNDRHAIDRKRWADWTSRVSAWLTGGIREIYFFVHEPDEALIPETLSDLAKSLVQRVPELSDTLRPWDPGGGSQLTLPIR